MSAEKTPVYVITELDVERVCRELRAGTPRKTIFANPVNPTRREFTRALANNPEWQALVDDADREWLISMAEELVEIADNSDNDTLTRQDGTTYPNTEWISRSKLRVETRLKMLAKLWPEKWGDKLAVSHTHTLDQLLASVPSVEDPIKSNAMLGESKQLVRH